MPAASRRYGVPFPVFGTARRHPFAKRGKLVVVVVVASGATRWVKIQAERLRKRRARLPRVRKRERGDSLEGVSHAWHARLLTCLFSTSRSTFLQEKVRRRILSRNVTTRYPVISLRREEISRECTRKRNVDIRACIGIHQSSLFC